MTGRTALALCLLLLTLLLPASNERTPLYLITINHAIGPASVDHFDRGLQAAIDAEAELLVLQLNTPGGLDSAMRQIIATILDAPLPVIVYVAPGGARAASAGTYILYASHVAAMAPATNLGSATPVSITAPTTPKGKEQDSEESTAPSAMERKAINDAVGYIRSLAQLRGRNEDWATKAVEQAANLPANDALKLGVIDLIANDRQHLIEQLNGRKVQLSSGEYIITVSNPEWITYQPDWRNQLLQVLTNPNVAYVLLMIGVWGIILEFYQPGGMIAGIVGSICLLIAMYAFQMLPINYAAAGLLLLGLGLLVSEAYAPSFGALGVGGIIALSFGSILLMETDLPEFQIARWLIALLMVSSALLTGLVLFLALKARQRPVVTGYGELLSQNSVALEDFSHNGQHYIGRVTARGELWQACSEQPISKSQRLTVVAIEGLTLTVKPEEH